MIKQSKYAFLFLLVLFLNCSSDENIDILNQQSSKIYTIESSSDPAITGLAEILENKNGSVTVNIELINTIEGNTYPAEIRFNHYLVPGQIAVSLNEVNGTTGKSSTNLSVLDDGTLLNYSSFLTLDAHISISESATTPNILVGVSDIGINELTGDSKTYFLTETNASGISGSVDFLERRNGEALVALNLEGTTTGEVYSSFIQMNDAVNTGAVVFTLNTLNGLDAVVVNGKTNLANLDGSSDFFGFDAVLEYDGHININDTSGVVAQTNIGINEENQIPQTITYDVTLNGTTAYVFNRNGLVDNENPDLSFVKGNTYILNLDVTGQPFYIKTVQDTGTTDLYNNGVTGNGNETGVLQFVVPDDAPDTLFYNSENEVLMTGIVTVID